MSVVLSSVHMSLFLSPMKTTFKTDKLIFDHMLNTKFDSKHYHGIDKRNFVSR